MSTTSDKKEYLCNPFDVSPSGDMFWADSRNVEELKKTIEQAEKERKEGNVTSCKTYEESLKLLESLNSNFKPHIYEEFKRCKKTHNNEINIS